MSELSKRQQEILQAIIEDYISSAMPVGSRTISKNFALSSATIRNEMSDLEDLGYLEQPHTSAGRVPSDKAYRFYVDNLMKLSKLSLPELDYIKGYYDTRIQEAGSVLSSAAKVISDLTEYVSIVTPPKMDDIRVSSIQLMQVNPITAMVVLLTDTGMVQNMPISLPRAMTSNELESMSRLLNEMFSGKSVDAIHPGAQFAVESEIADQKQLFDAICALLEARLDRAQKPLMINGASKVLSHQEFSDVEKARNLLQLLEEDDKIGDIVRQEDNATVHVHIGSETGLGDVSIVTASYSAGGKNLGKIGVIGPKRMKYDKVLSVLEEMGQTITKIFTDNNALEDKTGEQEKRK